MPPSQMVADRCLGPPMDQLPWKRPGPDASLPEGGSPFDPGSQRLTNVTPGQILGNLLLPQAVGTKAVTAVSDAVFQRKLGRLSEARCIDVNVPEMSCGSHYGDEQVSLRLLFCLYRIEPHEPVFDLSPSVRD